MLIPELRTNIFTTEAMIIPISPINRNCPMEVRSRLVTIPYILVATKVPEHIKKVEAIEELVYARKTIESVAPLRAA